MKPLVARFALLAVALTAASCWILEDLVSTACDDAKEHLCLKLPEMGCSTALMDDAVAGLKEDCGEEEAAAYIAESEAACRNGTLTCGESSCGDPKTLQYAGTAEADGRTAQLSLTFQGTNVKGQLVAGPVCGQSIRLTKTDISFQNAVLSGGAWEVEGASIQGSWTGGDYDCDGRLMDGYPTSGSVTIAPRDGKVYLERIAGAGKYVFTAQGKVYTPPACEDCAISSVSPNPVETGSALTITGSGFGTDKAKGEVTFGTTVVDPGNILAWSNTSIEVYTPYLAEGTVSVAVKVGGVSCGGYADLQLYEGGCVAAGTKVAMASGEARAIETLARGDAILAIDPETRAVRTATIKQVLVHGGAWSLSRLEFSSGPALRVTGNHPLLTPDGRWLPVDELSPGDRIFRLDPAAWEMREETILSIVRDQSATAVVYNLETTAGNYFAADIVVHNKCLKAGSLIDTPEGPVAVERVRVGQMIFGSVDGQRVATRVTHAYAKATVLEALPGKRLSPTVAVTANHQLFDGGLFVEASATGYPEELIPGKVYDLQTEAGNYFAGGVLMRAGE